MGNEHMEAGYNPRLRLECRGCEIDGVHVECSFSTCVPGGKVQGLPVRGSASRFVCLLCSESRLKTLETLEKRGRFAQIVRSLKSYCTWRKDHSAVYDSAMDRIIRWVPELKDHFERAAVKATVKHKLPVVKHKAKDAVKHKPSVVKHKLYEVRVNFVMRSKHSLVWPSFYGSSIGRRRQRPPTRTAAAIKAAKTNRQVARKNNMPSCPICKKSNNVISKGSGRWKCNVCISPYTKKKGYRFR